MGVSLYQLDQLIDVTPIDAVALDEQKEEKLTSEAFNRAVREIRELLETKKAIFTLGCSFGKDSTVVLLIVLEAYKQSIEAGLVEPERPLFVNTVNTGAEAIPMNLYVSYAQKRVQSYGASHNINVSCHTVKPPINDEYFVKYCGGQKLIPNPTRHGDCSIILKIDPSMRHTKALLKELESASGQYDYSTSPVINCVGSRSQESSRRSGNMVRQGIKDKCVNDLLDELDSDEISGQSIYRFAPIRDWTTDAVFTCLNISGSRPTKRSEFSLPGFLPNFGLLIEIYGNGANETCAITTGSKGSAGCNGKARFGCTVCTMVSKQDSSSIGLSRLKRWTALGVEDALRVRDWLYRLSIDMSKRAFHARAYDPVGYNRVALQPNTLQPKYLEKMVRYAAQLTQDAIAYAKHMQELSEGGHDALMSHEGYRDIVEDPTLPPKTKKQFLEMYVEGVKDPKNLNYVFTELHSLLLSFRWAIDGIGAVPYRPFAIYRQIQSGAGRIPYPKLNSELEFLGVDLSMQGYEELPDALMVKVLKEESPQHFATDPVRLLDLWQRPLDVMDIYETDMNCSVTQCADYTSSIEVKFDMNIDSNGAFVSYAVNRATIDGKKVNGTTLDLLLESGLDDEIKRYSIEYCAAPNFKSTKNISIRRELKHFHQRSEHIGYQSAKRKAEPCIHFTRRVTKVKNGQFKRGNTRMVFYPVVTESRIHRATKQEVNLAALDFGTHTQKHIHTYDSELMACAGEPLENINISQADLDDWKNTEGDIAALEMHDSHLKRLIKHRHLTRNTKPNLRRFVGNGVAEQLLAQGVVKIEKGYWAQLQAILKRTQIFASIDLFRFQSMSLAQVKAESGIVSMVQHRADKAKVLQCIRRIRNEQRRAHGSKGVDISVVLQSLQQTAVKAVHTLTDTLNAHLLKMTFDTHEVSVTDRAKASKLWLAHVLSKVSNVDDVLSRLLGQRALRELSASERLTIITQASKTLQYVYEHIESRLANWGQVSGAIEKLMNAEPDEKGALKKAFLSLRDELAPENLELMDISWWNPSLTGLVKHIQVIQRHIAANEEFLAGISEGLKVAVAYGQRSTVAKLTLADKLALMDAR